MDTAKVEMVAAAVSEARIVERARALVDVPSPTRDAGKAADRLAEMLAAEGFEVERPEADWPEAPAVVARLAGGKPGRILQFDGHLDTVHLPFKASAVEDGVLTGSGASDMKGGIAAFVEALRVLRDTEALDQGGVLLTAHDHHEGPWGDKRQLKALLRDGYVGDAVLFPEYLADRLPLYGRGMSIFNATFSRDGAPVHEVLRPAGLPDVVGAGTDFVQRLKALNAELGERSVGPGRDTVFVGQVTGGEIYNQAPTTCKVSGTRRWTAPGDAERAVAEVRGLAEAAAAATGADLAFEASIQGDAFSVAEDDPAVTAFQAAHRHVTGGELPTGEKPFLDDGNLVRAIAGKPVITHGPDATGAHTTEERVPVAELVRVAKVYAGTAVGFCGIEDGR